MTTIYVNATALSNLPKRRDFDYYPTPLTVCEDALTYLPLGFKPLNILDPGAGAGSWGKAARRRWPESLITSVEIRPEATRPRAYNFWMHTDFRLLDAVPAFDLVVGNPPYNIAESFIKHSLACLEPDGYLIFLLRLNLLEGQQRARTLWRANPPRCVVARAGRVSFSGDGNTNATAYAYFIWQKSWRGEPVLKWSLAA